MAQRFKAGDRSFAARAIFTVAMTFVLICKVLHIPQALMPKKLAAFVRSWTYSMLWAAIRSGMSRVYIDQTCRFKPPTSYAPAAEVDPEYRLDESQIRSFYDRGYLGPFDAFTPEEMNHFRQFMYSLEGIPSETYGFDTPRDRHLEQPEILRLMLRPAILERVAQLLGPDVACWRSQLIYKTAGSPRIQWHQTSTFLVEDYIEPALYPPDRDALFQVTVWIAVDDAVRENGCMQFCPGTHDRIRQVELGGRDGFYRKNYELLFASHERDATSEENLDTVQVKSGQFILFTERCVHGSLPNDSDRDRLAFNYRLIRPDTAAYPNRRSYRSSYNGGKYYLKDWGTVLLRGEDRHHRSRSRDLQQLLSRTPAHIAASGESEATRHAA